MTTEEAQPLQRGSRVSITNSVKISFALKNLSSFNSLFYTGSLTVSEQTAQIYGTIYKNVST